MSVLLIHAGKERKQKEGRDAAFGLGWIFLAAIWSEKQSFYLFF